MYVQILATLYNISLYLNKIFTQAKTAMRTLLGPEPQHYVIMDDGRIFATCIPIPETVRSAAYFYNTHTQRITTLDCQEPDGRFRRIPFLSMVVYDDRVGNNHDLSDWIGEVRANPVPANLHVKHYVHLWSVVHNTYIPGAGGRVVVTHSDGTKETIVL